jgi:alcohol dehydrogenase class IV
MSITAFKIANKLITGAAAIEQLAAELTRLNINNPLIVTDAMLVKSGTWRWRSWVGALMASSIK